jgi:hypothetical protein
MLESSNEQQQSWISKTKKVMEQSLQDANEPYEFLNKIGGLRSLDMRGREDTFELIECLRSRFNESLKSLEIWGIMYECLSKIRRLESLDMKDCGDGLELIEYIRSRFNESLRYLKVLETAESRIDLQRLRDEFGFSGGWRIR